MSAETITPVDPQEQADLANAWRHFEAGTPLDPELAKPRYPLRGCFPGPAGDGDCPPDPSGTLRLHVYRPGSAGALRVRHRRSEAREQSPAAVSLRHTPVIPALIGGRPSSTTEAAEN